MAFFDFAKILPNNTDPIKGTIQITTSVSFIFKIFIKVPNEKSSKCKILFIITSATRLNELDY